jgi:hypothetical protein
MRKMGIVLTSFIIGLVTVGLVTGQQEQQQPKKKFGGGGFGGGFGFGGFGGKGGAMNSLTLINNEQVKKELEITQEQLDKVPDAIQKALGDVLNEKQLKRLRQIDLQTRGVGAFSDAKVKKELKISDEQSESIKTVIDESVKERQELFKEAQGGNFEGMQEKMTALTKETQEKVQAVLSADQRKQWKQMIGDEFKLENQGFGGFGGGKGFGKKKKKDA